ncbi:MAG TPA: hypothetical protein VIA18_33180 [Polyangia bacterium]|jgi:hypothetical protein|nr:hypothetical protein [Polyangia bacterium]
MSARGWWAFAVVLVAGPLDARAAPPPSPSPIAWRYEVQADAGARTLAVDARFEAGDPTEFSVDDGAEPFVDDVNVETARGWRKIARRDDAWRIAECARGCHVRYRVRLDAAATALDSDVAQHYGAVVQAPPPTWLLHPLRATGGRRYRFVVRMPVGLAFVSGVAPDGDGYAADVTTLGDAPYSAFGPLTLQTLNIGHDRIDLAFVPAQRKVDDATIAAVVAHAAEAVRRYYGRLPLPRQLMLVLPGDGEGLHGHTLGNGGATVELVVGDTIDKAQLAHSWVPAHELIHVAFPSLPRAQLWLEEGLATYVEPLARAQLGDLDAATIWRDLVDGLPQGLPEAGDRGLDRTHTWGRTYWGGALFCLVADVEIRERTHGQHGLGDALRAIVDGGGNISVEWPLQQALAIGDAAVGVPVLTELHARLGERPGDVDLASLWRRLGVQRVGRGVKFDDSAPLASVRRAIVERP